MGERLIPSWGGVLVDADELVTLLPLVSLDGDSAISEFQPTVVVSREQLRRDYISQMGTVCGGQKVVYSPPAGGSWYVIKVCS